MWAWPASGLKWAWLVVGVVVVQPTTTASITPVNSSVVNVPSELLLQLVEVSRAVQKLLPSKAEDTTTEDALAHIDETGYSSVLSLALRHHALLQQKNEDLLIQQGRCNAKIEALLEDKQELKQQLDEARNELQFFLDGGGGQAASTTQVAVVATTVPTEIEGKAKVELEVEDKCECNVTEAELEECVCGGIVNVTDLPPPTTTTPPVKLLGGNARVRDCAGHQNKGSVESGLYEIYPSECKAVRVWCDLETDGGGWTVFLYRQEQEDQENFTRTWQDYRDGFGDVTSEYWLGNEILHQLTGKEAQVLRVDAEDFNGSRRWGVWGRFRVDDEEHSYKLTCVMYYANSSLGDGLLWHSDMKFSTIDRDNDMHKGSCASEYKGGWWYNVCHNANPTGILLNSDDFDSVGWVYWSPRLYKWASLRSLQMKIRPKDFGVPDPATAPRDCASD